MTKEEFLARIENAWNMGLCDEKVLALTESWVDGVMRYEGGQMGHWQTFLDSESLRTNGFDGLKTLANDVTGYKAIQLLAILTHPCPTCAIDPNAWHTRPGFCPHKLNQPKPASLQD